MGGLFSLIQKHFGACGGPLYLVQNLFNLRKRWGGHRNLHQNPMSHGHRNCWENMLRRNNLETKPRHLHTRLQAGTCADIWRKSGQIETSRGEDEKKHDAANTAASNNTYGPNIFCVGVSRWCFPLCQKQFHGPVLLLGATHKRL
jgi:hypothetical protein